jgi:hypothetical protein
MGAHGKSFKHRGYLSVCLFYNGVSPGPNGKRNYDSNHRFSTSRTDIAEVVAKGWVDEGMVLCVPQ